VTVIDAVLAVHQMRVSVQCGARSIPIVHHHGIERDSKPGPLRVMRCTEKVGHEGLHKDAICCWNFQRFADWQVAEVKPVAHPVCEDCHTGFPCATIRAIQEAS
jgi:hypothetical protein